MHQLITLTDRGLYCPPGDFYIDPWRPTGRAVITHAHSDHARWGAEGYLTAEPGRRVLQSRLGANACIETMPYGQTVNHHGVTISFHPAGHVLGSAQVRLEYQGYVGVITGDYKLEQDTTCQAFEPVKCHTILTESTFGLPVYRWMASELIFADINQWWRENRSAGRASIIFGYSLGKAQRILSGLDASIGPIYLHGAIEKMTRDYRASGIELPPTSAVSDHPAKHPWAGSMIIAPPSAQDTAWQKKFGNAATASTSGWMHVRGARRRRGVDRGFVLSDHVDWPGLLQAIEASQAETVWVTHGFVNPVVRYLRERGLDASGLTTMFTGDAEEPEAGTDSQVSESQSP